MTVLLQKLKTNREIFLHLVENLRIFEGFAMKIWGLVTKVNSIGKCPRFIAMHDRIC
jgi:hypothetical protein